MKKLLLTVVTTAVLSMSGVMAATSFDTFKRASDQGLIDLSSGLYGTSLLQRQQFAPVLLKYIEKIAQKEYTTRACNAKDLGSAESAYQSDLEKLCKYGILNGEKGKLYPLWQLTNGQAVALIMRIIDGWQDESTLGGRHRSQGYFDRARGLGYDIDQLSRVKNAPITYEGLINFLYSTKYPNQQITEKINNQLSPNTNFHSSDDALRRLAEIMA
ncbi:MAG: hypothetical protein Q4B28_08475, partial [bacterium]|nr:hypothetical protein [bacterium]